MVTLSVLIIVSTQQLSVPPTIQYGEVTVAEARSLLDVKAVLVVLVVRTSKEYTDGHIEGAIVIPLSELADPLDELTSEDELLIYCRTGNRSTTAMNILVANGYQKLFHMHGGIAAWIDVGYPTVHE